MNEFDRINKITNIFKNYNFEPPISGIPDSLKHFSDMFKNFNSEPPISVIPDSLKHFSDMLKNFNSEPPISYNYDVIKSITDNLRNIYHDTLISNNNTIGISTASANINIDLLKNINFAIVQTVNNITKKTNHDDTDNEIVNNLSSCALKMAVSKNVPVSIKNNLLFIIAKNLWKLLGIPQFSFLFAIIVYILSLIASPEIPQKNYYKTISKQTINQITIIVNENKELNLRGIIYNKTIIHKKPNNKSTVIFRLYCGDIVEVIKTNKKWLYIRVYKTGIEGWILKKYTKGR